MLRFHITDDGLPAVLHMDMLDANELLTTSSQASKYLDLPASAEMCAGTHWS